MNNNPASSLWSVQQHAWLRALGHTVWLYGSALTALPLPKTSSAQSSPTTDVQHAAALLNPDQPAPVSTRAEPVEDSAQTPAALPPILDPLVLALLRASGFHPNHPHIHHLIASWPLQELRTSPAAKRALWPQLRALRRTHHTNDNPEDRP